MGERGDRVLIKSEVDKNSLIKEIKENYSLVVVTLEDMTKIIYSRSDKVYSRNLSELQYLGLFGSAYKYSNNRVSVLEWLRISSDKYLVHQQPDKEADKLDNIVFHDLLVKKGDGSSKLTLLEVIRDEQ